MTSIQREQLRLSLLGTLSGVSDTLGMSKGMLFQFVRSEGRRWLLAEQVEQEMLYLVDKGLALPVAKSISPENTAWRITADGRDFLAQQAGD